MNDSTNDTDGRPYGMPSPTPLSAPPAVDPLEAVEAWRIAVRHVGELGGQDRAVIAWLAGHAHRDAVAAATTATVASLVRRAWSAGVEVGRSERLDEAAEVAAAHRAARDLADSVLALVAQADTDLDDATADARYLAENLIEAVTRAVEGHSGGADRLAKAGECAVARYRAVIAKTVDAEEYPYATRQLAVVVAVETSASLLDSDAELAAAVRAVLDADHDRDLIAEDRMAAVVDQEQGDDDGLQPGDAVAGVPGFVVGVCGHRIAGSEWSAGFRDCERCDNPESADQGESCDQEPTREDAIDVLQRDAVRLAVLQSRILANHERLDALRIRIQGAPEAPERDEIRPELTAPDAHRAYVLDDPADVVDQDLDTGVAWCRICQEQPAHVDADGEGLCATCQVALAEGRTADPASGAS